jgi:hypothetical protein
LASSQLNDKRWNTDARSAERIAGERASKDASIVCGVTTDCGAALSTV